MKVSVMRASCIHIFVVAAMRVGEQALCADASNLYSWGAQQTAAQRDKKCSYDCGGGGVKHGGTGRSDSPTGSTGEFMGFDRRCRDLDYVGVFFFEIYNMCELDHVLHFASSSSLVCSSMFEHGKREMSCCQEDGFFISLKKITYPANKKM